jgi:hypothetical protein
LGEQEEGEEGDGDIGRRIQKNARNAKREIRVTGEEGLGGTGAWSMVNGRRLLGNVWLMMTA